VSVRASEVNEERAADIMYQYGAVDIDHRFAEGEFARERGELSVPVVREELQVGKRTVQRGVRVYSRVVEEPVEEKVRIRQERARVDRIPADRPATEADIRAGSGCRSHGDV
jgi:stress response protein YsnF